MRLKSRCGGTYFCHPNQTIGQTHVERKTEEQDGLIQQETIAMKTAVHSPEEGSETENGWRRRGKMTLKMN